MNHRVNKGWLRLQRGARWPAGSAGNELCRRLRNTARACDAVILITSGQRTNRQQHRAYMDYLSGGILAAPCCGKQYQHSWAQCGKACQSRHCAGRAADCIIQKPNGDWVNIGEWDRARHQMRGHGLCLPVGAGETWHVEVGEYWRS